MLIDGWHLFMSSNVYFSGYGNGINTTNLVIGLYMVAQTSRSVWISSIDIWIMYSDKPTCLLQLNFRWINEDQMRQVVAFPPSHYSYLGTDGLNTSPTSNRHIEELPTLRSVSPCQAIHVYLGIHASHQPNTLFPSYVGWFSSRSYDLKCIQIIRY